MKKLTPNSQVDQHKEAEIADGRPTFGVQILHLVEGEVDIASQGVSTNPLGLGEGCREERSSQSFLRLERDGRFALSEDGCAVDALDGAREEREEAFKVLHDGERLVHLSPSDLGLCEGEKG